MTDVQQEAEESEIDCLLADIDVLQAKLYARDRRIQRLRAVLRPAIGSYASTGNATRGTTVTYSSTVVAALDALEPGDVE